jgi:hypothetical protein
MNFVRQHNVLHCIVHFIRHHVVEFDDNFECIHHYLVYFDVITKKID